MYARVCTGLPLHWDKDYFVGSGPCPPLWSWLNYSSQDPKEAPSVPPCTTDSLSLGLACLERHKRWEGGQEREGSGDHPVSGSKAQVRAPVETGSAV